MGAVKNAYHDEICADAAEEDGIDGCTICGDDMAVEEGFCEACWEQHVGQFGVGA